MCSLFNTISNNDYYDHNYVFFKYFNPIFLTRYTYRNVSDDRQNYENKMMKSVIKNYENDNLILSAHIYCKFFEFKKFNSEVLKKCNDNEKINEYTTYDTKYNNMKKVDKYTKIFINFSFNDIKEFYL